MTRDEFENELRAKLLDIRALYQRYDPDAVNDCQEYLSMAIHKGKIFANNIYWKTDKPINFYIDENSTRHKL